MPDMIQSLGRDYFDQLFAGSLVLLDGRVLKVHGTEGRANVVTCVNMENNDIERIPANKFTGFKTFEYPLLGYRRLGEHHIAWATKNQSVHRGLRLQNVHLTWTAATRFLIDLGAINGARVSEQEKSIALFKPQFDSLADAPALLEGTKTGLVLSPHLLIEPSTEAENEWYVVQYKQANIGKIDAKGAVRFKSPERHGHLLPANILQR